MEKYKVFLSKCSPTDIPGDIASALWALLVQLPFNIFSFILQLLVYVLKVLNLGSLLEELQNSVITSSKSVFTALIGGKAGFIGTSSFVGLAVILMAAYLLYQFTNGKGRFVSSLLHFLCVFMLVFFYFGSFTGGSVSTESGGRFLFQTVQKVTSSAQSEITKALNPTVGSNDPSSVFTTYLKNTANYINTGNIEGKLKDGKTFDYDKVNDSYLEGIDGDDKYIQANNDVLVQKITFGVTQSLDAYVMVLPMAVIEILISVLNLVLLLLILLFPVTAALSFFPFFRNAAMNGLKKMLLLSALPSGLSIILSIILYLLGQIDSPVEKAVAMAKVPEAFSFLVTLIVELLLKAAMLYGLWHYRESLLDFLTGGQVQERGLGNSIHSGIRNTLDGSKKIGNSLKEGVVTLATGPELMLEGELLSHRLKNVSDKEEFNQTDSEERQGPPLTEEEREEQLEAEDSLHHVENHLGEETEELTDLKEFSALEDSEELDLEGEDENLDSQQPLDPFVSTELSEVEENPLIEDFSSFSFDGLIQETEVSKDWDGAIEDMNQLRGEKS